MIENPYAREVGDRDPLALMAETPGRIRVALTELGAAGSDRSYAPGKWTARQIVIHLAQFEVMTAARIRMALVEDDYVAQNFNQDAWQVFDESSSAKDAFEVYSSLRRMTLSLLRRLPEAGMRRELSHPLYGTFTVGWLIAQVAGHELRHLEQLRSIARAQG